MTKYVTTGRITLDGKNIIEPGNEVDLTDEQAKDLGARGFVKAVPQAAPQVVAGVVSNQPAQGGGAVTIDEVKQDEQKLAQDIQDVEASQQAGDK
ncbi:hypothetical protein ACOALA_04080 [Alicyclobacillus acidoterrestris]|uniref:hypothetical protein n=1 Tax=Alicyclobacillus acidoterrestris TaxID=1450 RepID=UPI003F538D3B